MSTRRLISDVYKTHSLLLVAALFLSNCCAKTSPIDNCVTSCGNIPIKRPFRLIGDPPNCGQEKYELKCEHNRLVLNLSSSGYYYYLSSSGKTKYYEEYYGKYYVHAINYDNYTIRVVDVGLQQGNCSSLPLYSLSDPYHFDPESYSLLLPWPYGNEGIYGDYKKPVPWGMAVALWVDCKNPVNKSPFYTDGKTGAPSCIEKQITPPTSLSSGEKGHYSYFLFGTNITASDVADQCRINEIVMSTLRWPPADHKSDAANMSFSDFHREVEYGFELSWLYSLCEKCQGRSYNCRIINHTAICGRDCSRTVAGYKNLSVYASLRCRLDVFFTSDLFYNHVGPALKITGWILVGRTSLGILCLLAYLIYKFTRRHLSMFDTIEDFLQISQDNLMPIRYSFFEIKKMTRGFKDKLGEGGYGSVYKGKLRSGYLAAIKSLGNSKGNGQEFINEVATIGRIHHVNVVRLIGFCATRSKRALVCEFMPNGSLDKYLFSEEGSITLSCKQIYDISVGVARGIEYLHRGCDMQILHFDIKPHNILLDENFNPKISDFGLAKLCSSDNSMVSLTAARGTMGYMAPELFYKNIGRVSYKADVYSYGMLLMEMAGKRRNLNPFADHSSQIYFPSWIYDQFKEGNEIEMGEATEEESELMKKMVITALWCIQMAPSDRPSMNKVVEMLEGNVESLEMPPKPFLIPQEMAAEDQ